MKNNQWGTPLRYAVVFSTILAAAWFINVIWPLLNAMVLSALVAYVLHPLVNWFTQRTPLSRTPAVNLVYIFFLTILVAVPTVLTPVILRQVINITPDFESVGEEMMGLLSTDITIGNLTIPLEPFVADIQALLNQTFSDLVGTAFSTIAELTTNLLWILLILVSIYYLLRDGRRFIDWLVDLLPQAYHYHAGRLLTEIDGVWSSFLRGQIFLMMVMGIGAWLICLAVGLPGAAIIGIITGLFDIIPSIGPIFATFVAMALAFLEGSTVLPVSNLVFTIIMGVIFFIIQQAEGIWLRPAIMGRRLRLHPLLIFVGVFGALSLSGVLVALIIVPVMSTIGVLWRYGRARVNGIDPFPPPADAEIEPPPEVEPVESTVATPAEDDSPQPSTMAKLPRS